MKDNSLSQRLTSALEKLNLALDKTQQEKLLGYVALLSKWNRAFNLTALKSSAEILTQLVISSLSVLPYINGTHVIDVGTGSGVPGLPLACALSSKQFVLLDSNGKKTRFLQQTIYELDLKNVTVMNDRVENYHPEQLFNVIITRAFSSLADMVRLTQHLLEPQGCFLALKSQRVTEVLPKEFKIIATHELVIPNWQTQYLIGIRRN